MSSPRNALPQTEVDATTRRRARRTGLLAASLAVAITAATGTVSGMAESPSQAPAESDPAAKKVTAVLRPAQQEQLKLISSNGGTLTLDEMIRTAEYYGKSPYGLTENTANGQSMHLEDPVGVGMGASNAWYKVAAHDNVLTVAYGGNGEIGKDPDSYSLSMTFTNPEHPVQQGEHDLSPYYAQAFLSRRKTQLSGLKSSTGTLVYDVSIAPNGTTEVARVSGDDIQGPNAPMDGRYDIDQLQANPNLTADFIGQQITGQVQTIGSLSRP
jgi:hypothetical protein